MKISIESSGSDLLTSTQIGSGSNGSMLGHAKRKLNGGWLTRLSSAEIHPKDGGISNNYFALSMRSIEIMLRMFLGVAIWPKCYGMGSLKLST